MISCNNLRLQRFFFQWQVHDSFLVCSPCTHVPHSWSCTLRLGIHVVLAGIAHITH